MSLCGRSVAIETPYGFEKAERKKNPENISLALLERSLNLHTAITEYLLIGPFCIHNTQMTD